MPASSPAAPRRRGGIPEATVARLPVYLRVLHGLAEAGTPTVSSESLAAAAGVGSAKLRKDLSHLGSYGTRGVGYDVEYLVYQISRVARPDAALHRRHRRSRQPRPCARQLRRLRHPRLPDRGARRLRPPSGRRDGQRARGAAPRRPRDAGQRTRGVHRRHRNSGAGRAGCLRPPRRVRGDERAQLRADGAVRA